MIPWVIPPFGPALILRAALVWALGRLAVEVGTRSDPLRAAARAPFEVDLATILALIAATVLLCWVDVTWRRRESLLLAALGATRASVVATIALPPVALEILMAAYQAW